MYIFSIRNAISYVSQLSGKADRFDLIVDLATLGQACGFNPSNKTLEFKHKCNELPLCSSFQLQVPARLLG